MKEIIVYFIIDADEIIWEIGMEEFILNWNSQVPHWDLLTDDGISFFKGEKKQKWERP